MPGIALIPRDTLAERPASKDRREPRRHSQGLCLSFALIVVIGLLVLSSTVLGGGNSSAPSVVGRPISSVISPELRPSASGGNLTVSIHNIMPTATGPYQQRISIDSAALSAWINSNWTNGRVYDASGTPLYAWIESGASNASNDTQLWVRMDSIAAGGWANLTIAFGPMTSFDLSAKGYMGEAPQLSASYGAFDNGGYVFNLYDDFAGTTLSSQWVVNGAWNVTVNNGISVSQVPGDGGAILSARSFAEPAALDFDGNFFVGANARAYLDEGFGTAGCIACGNASDVGWGVGSSGGPAPYTGRNGSITTGATVYATQRFAVFSTEAINTSVADFSANYGGAQTLTTSIPTITSLPIRLAGSGFPSGPLTNPSTTYWIRERTYEPQMPIATVSGVPDYSVTFTANGLNWGTSWTVQFGRSSATSPGPISFLVPNGTFAFNVGSIAGFTAHPSTGNVTVTGSSQSVTIQFSTASSRSYYAVDFLETGLPTGSSWSVRLNGTSHSGTTSTIGFTEPNGTYAYTVGCGSNYTAAPSSGNATVAGSLLAVAITCQNATGALVPLRSVTFTSQGLPGGLEWTVTLTALSSGLTILSPTTLTRTSVGDQPISFRTSAGAFSFVASAPGYGSRSGTVTVATAPNVTVSVSFVAETSTSPGPMAPRLSEYWEIGVALFAIGAVGLALTTYRARARRIEQGRLFVQGIAGAEWSRDASGEPEPRVKR